LGRQTRFNYMNPTVAQGPYHAQVLRGVEAVRVHVDVLVPHEDVVVRLHRVVAVQVEFEKLKLNPGNHIAGSRVERPGAFKLWVGKIQLPQPHHVRVEEPLGEPPLALLSG
jgi:hypothetical protein